MEGGFFYQKKKGSDFSQIYDCTSDIEKKKAPFLPFFFEKKIKKKICSRGENFFFARIIYI